MDLKRMLNGYFVKAVYPGQITGDITLYELVDLIMPLIKSKLEEEEITECPMCPDCPDNCPLEVEHETD